MIILDAMIAIITAFILVTIFVGVSQRVRDIDKVIAIILIINLAIVICLKYLLATINP